MPDNRRRKVAVVLFNLGGPDRPEAIRPFLLNLFMDPAILRVPLWIRAILARVIVLSRLRTSRKSYGFLRSASPLLDLTRDQAKALRAALPDADVACFIAMRYWHPLTRAAVAAVRAWQPDEIVLLPLYPQFSTTTTGSSLSCWEREAAAAGLRAPTYTIQSYGTDEGFTKWLCERVRSSYNEALCKLAPGVPLRILFSAHGLPVSVVAAGDPYQRQVEETVAAVVKAMKDPGLDHVICYQSRATPQRWLEPSTLAEISRAAQDRAAILVVPVAFVCEHLETLVESTSITARLRRS